MEEKNVYDITIIGGGPAGLFAAFYAGLREMSVKIVEYQQFLGGKVNVYPEKMIWDIGGLTPLPAAKLIDQMVEQAKTFDPEIVLGQKAVAISQEEDKTYVLHTECGAKHYTKTIIAAVGGGILRPTKLEVEGAEKFELTNLHYTVKSLARFKDKVVLISGGGNAAVDWANELEPIAKKVYLTYRKDNLKGHEAEVSKLAESTVDLLLNTEIKSLQAGEDHSHIQKVVLTHKEDGTELELNVDEVIINHGYDRELGFLKNSGLNINLKDDYWVDGAPNSETNIPGIYAAGDILHHEGKLHLIAGAFQDAANAVNEAKVFIQPDANKWGMVSSHNDLFQKKNKELIKHLYKVEA